MEQDQFDEAPPGGNRWGDGYTMAPGRLHVPRNIRKGAS